MSIIKGKKISAGKKLRDHLLMGPENKSICVLQIKGLATNDPDEAMRMMDVVRHVKNVDKPLYMAILNLSAGERLSDEQIIESADIIEKQMKLEGHQRIIIKHTKPIKNKEGQIIDEDHEHIHIIWNRYPPFEGKAVKIDGHFQAHGKAMALIDKKYGLKSVITKTYSVTKAEIEEAKRHGYNIFQVRQRVSDAYLERKSSEEFQQKLQKMGMALCVGDKGQILVVLPWKKHKALSSLVEGRPKKAELAEALDPIRANLEHIQVVLDKFVVRGPNIVDVPTTRIRTRQSPLLTEEHTFPLPQVKTPQSSIFVSQDVRTVPPPSPSKKDGHKPEQIPSRLSQSGQRRVEQWFKKNEFKLSQKIRDSMECAADYRLYKAGQMTLDAFLYKWAAFLGHVAPVISPGQNR